MTNQDQTPQPFAENCLTQAQKINLELKYTNNVLAVGATQIGKQRISLDLAEVFWADFKKLCKEDGNDSSLFIVLDLLCDSSKDVRQQKKDDHVQFWGPRLENKDTDHAILLKCCIRQQRNR